MGEKSYVELGNQISEMVRLRACPNRIENRKRTSKSIRFRECFRRCVESKRKKRNAAEKRGRAATYGPFITMNTCQQSSFRQHRSTGAAGIHDNISTPSMEVVARPTLTPRDQTLNHTEHELPALFSRACGNHLQFGSHARKQRLENVGAVVAVRLLAI